MRNRHSTGLSVIIAAFISALLLSLLCGMFYNMWKYEIERILLEEGGWQSRITGLPNQEAMDSIKNFATIKDVVVHEAGTQEETMVVDLYFYHMGNVLEDTPKIARLAGISEEDLTYHYELLAMYLIRDSRDKAPRLVFPLFLLIMTMASVSLVVIIHNAFALTMNERIHHLGILSSIGATPRQIRACLMKESASLCVLPVLAGNLLGILLSMILLHMINALLGSQFPQRHESVFGYHPLVLSGTLLVTVATIGISAWLPARKLSRLTPLEAIKNTEELHLKRRKRSPILTCFFGMEGKLAGNGLKAQKKALRTSSWSLSLSFMAFTLMYCFFTLSEISTRETYFEKYQNLWDIMVTIKDKDIDSFQEAQAIQELSQVQRAIVYQKAWAKRIVTEEEISEEMKELGGFAHASLKDVQKTPEGWMVNVPVIIMDDCSFLAYCEEIGIPPSLDGAVIQNRIRDVTNPDFRHPRYMPYIKTDNKVSILRQPGREAEASKLPVLAYTEKAPALREEYGTLDYYELVHILPVSLWKEIKEKIGHGEKDTFICVLAGENASREELNSLQESIRRITANTCTTKSENRIEEYELNQKQIYGMKMILGGFCMLLAIIGIGNIFSNTLGFVRQRRREVARYLSVGLTPKGLCRMFCIEGLAVAGRPVLLSLPPAAAAIGYMLKISYLDVGEFLAEAPLPPILAFTAAVWGAVALAYYLGWRSVRKISLAEVLKDDTMI